MIKYPIINLAILKKHKGEYIQLGGTGIMDGIKLAPDKLTLYRIEEIVTKDDFSECYMHGYRKKKRQYLPEGSFRQECRIFTKKEWKDMPICGISTKRLWSEKSGIWSCSVLYKEKD